MNPKNLLTSLFRAWKVLLGVVGILLLIVWSSGMLKDKTAPGVVAVEPGFPRPAGAETITITREAIPGRISVAGTVTSEEKIHVSARVGGVVENVLISAGDRVVRGQDLLRIDDREMREQMAAAEAQLRRAETEFRRTRQLFAAEAATQQQMTDAESAFHTAQARVEQLRVALTYHTIQAPIDGIVTDRRIEQGDLAQPGQILLAVYNPSAMRVDAPVPVRLIRRLQLGASVPVWLDRADAKVTGTVTEIVSEVDAATRTQIARVRIDAGDLTLFPGTFARLWIDLDTREGYRVPASAVFRAGQLEMVQMVVTGDRVVRRLVRTGPVENGQVELLSGVAAGDRVLVQPVMD